MACCRIECLETTAGFPTLILFESLDKYLIAVQVNDDSPVHFRIVYLIEGIDIDLWPSGVSL
jgi:hypothetical protein